jgi:hypothetical protein
MTGHEHFVPRKIAKWPLGAAMHAAEILADVLLGGDFGKAQNRT